MIPNTINLPKMKVMKKSIILFLVVMLSASELPAQKFGNCINLDGIGDYLVVPHQEILNPANGSWSVAFWIKAADKDQVSPIVMKLDAEYPYSQYTYGFGMDDPHDPQPGKRIRVNHIESAGISERSGYTTNEIIDGNWHHIAIVADKSADAIFIYIDGDMVGFNPLYYFGQWPNVVNTSKLIIASYSPEYCIEGQLDELNIWNKALSLAQVRMVKNDTIAPVYYNNPDSGLVAYYRFERFEDLGIYGGDSDDIRDLSSWYNHADAEGNPELIPSGVPYGIDPLIYPIDLSMGPNPSNKMFSLQFATYNHQSCEIELVDIFGKLVCILYNGKLDKGNMEFDISNLPAGVYFVRISSWNSQIVKKIVKL